MKKPRNLHLYAIITSVFLIAVYIWHIDMLVSRWVPASASTLWNGFYHFNDQQIYHILLYMAGLSIFFLSFSVIHLHNELNDIRRKHDS